MDDILQEMIRTNCRITITTIFLLMHKKKMKTKIETTTRKTFLMKVLEIHELRPRTNIKQDINDLSYFMQDNA